MKYDFSKPLPVDNRALALLARNLAMPIETVERGLRKISEQELLGNPYVERITDQFLLTGDLSILRELTLHLSGREDE